MYQLVIWPQAPFSPFSSASLWRQPLSVAYTRHNSLNSQEEPRGLNILLKEL